MLNVQSRLTLTPEIHRDGAQVPEMMGRLNFIPLTRVAFESQPFLANRVDVAVPSQFTVSLLPSTDYMIELVFPDGTSDAYLKDVTCGSTVHRNSFKLDDIGCELHITVGTDMGKLTATIVDKENNNDSASLVCIYPTSAVTLEEIGSTGACLSADPGTMSISTPLRPDKYLALVMPQGSADWVQYVLVNRSQATPVEIQARLTVQMTLKSNKGR